MLRLATDWQDYAEQMLAVCNGNAHLESLSTDRTYVGKAGLPAADALREARRPVGPGVWDLAYIKTPATPTIGSRAAAVKKLPRIPSTMNCTASAARITPDNLLTTFAPVSPRTCISRGVASIKTQQTASTRATTAEKPRK